MKHRPVSTVVLAVLIAGLSVFVRAHAASPNPKPNIIQGNVYDPPQFASDGAHTAAVGNCQLTDTGTHFDVVLNYENGATPYQVGQDYGTAIKAVCPQFEQLLDSYIAEGTQGSKLIYKFALRRVHQIQNQIQPEYRQEIDGIASKMSGGDDNKMNDGKVSVDELYLLNLLADVARVNQCCAVGAYGEGSATNSPVCGRNLDWPDGKDNQLTKLQAVTTFKNGGKSLVNISCLAFVGAVSAFNKEGVFAGVLDSPTGTKYKASGKRSYVMDLRQALEQSHNLEQVADFMKDPEKKYTFNHLIYLADQNSVAVLENNFSGHGTQMRRELRRDNSQLRNGAPWAIPYTVGAVNCFCLDGNDDNHIDPMDVPRIKKQAKSDGPKCSFDVNTPRWLAMQNELRQAGPLTTTGVKLVLAEHHGPYPGSLYDGDLYNTFTLQSIVFEPRSGTLEVFFRPRNGKLPARPVYEPIAIQWSF